MFPRFTLFAVVVTALAVLSFLEILVGTNVMWSSVDRDMDCSIMPQSTSRKESLPKKDFSLWNTNLARQLTQPHHEHDSNMSSSPASPLSIASGKDCVCDLMSIDCLDSIACLPSELQASRQSMALGVMTRRAMKNLAKFQFQDSPESDIPIGKGLQYNSIDAWKSWMKWNRLPLSTYHNEHSIFVEESRYKYCKEHEILGKACFFDDLDAPEDLYDAEIDALANGQLPNQTSQVVLRDVKEFKAKHKSKQSSTKPTPLGYLLSFAHMVRIRFHLRSFLQDIFEQRVQQVNHVVQNDKVLRVSLHMRRADACDHAQEGFEEEASPLDSPSQVTGKRKCYATSVYLDALRRVKESVSPDTTIQVHLSTDHAGNVVKEIQQNYTELYQSMNWRFLNYGQEEGIFKYEDTIEGDYVEAKQRALLGESAIMDLLLVSQGSVFIGHLGSRFGKMSWLLMTARTNGFVPFFSVDGHSFCCEIDEACADVKPYVTSMENCMTFSHELEDDIPLNKDYWEVGSQKRKRYFEMKRKKMIRKIKNEPYGEQEVYNDEESYQEEESEREFESPSHDEKDNENDEEEKDGDDEDGYFKDLNAPVVDWDYFPARVRNLQSVEEPTLNFSSVSCSSLTLNTDPPPKRPVSKGACDGYDGVLHIQHGDWGGASGTIFFLFVIALLQWADQHNYKPFVHMDDYSVKVYDEIVHGNTTEKTRFYMLHGMEIEWYRDRRDPKGNTFPGKPKVGKELKLRKYMLQGTGVWEHYFLPVSDFVPGDASCKKKPLVSFDADQLAPGIHSNAPWSPRAWRISGIDYIDRDDLSYDEWFAPQRAMAAATVQRYIRFQPSIQQRAACAHPRPANSLGMHIRHGDKWIEREVIPVSSFLPYAKAFVKHGGGSIFVATDSALVMEEIRNEWPPDVASHVVHQEVQGLSPNGTAAFDLAGSKHQSNTEALTDLLALSKCTYFLHGLSALSETVFYLNPGLVERAVNLEDYDQGRDVKYFTNKMLLRPKKKKKKTKMKKKE